MKDELIKITVLIPNNTLEKVDAAAAKEGSCRAWFILNAVETALSSSQTIPEDDRLLAIEDKLDALLAASQVASSAFRRASKAKTQRL